MTRSRKPPPPFRPPARLFASVAILLAAFTFSAPAAADHSAFVQVEGATSVLTEWAGGDLTPSTAAYGATIGYHWDTLELAALVDHTYWLADGVTRSGGFADTVLNAAVEGAFTSFRDRARHALAVGTSTMLFATPEAPRGHTGLFVEVKPVGLRLGLGAGWRVELEPLNFAIMAPVLDGIPLVNVAYRTNMGFGREF